MNKGVNGKHYTMLCFGTCIDGIKMSHVNHLLLGELVSQLYELYGQQASCCY